LEASKIAPGEGNPVFPFVAASTFACAFTRPALPLVAEDPAVLLDPEPQAASRATVASMAAAREYRLRGAVFMVVRTCVIIVLDPSVVPTWSVGLCDSASPFSLRGQMRKSYCNDQRSSVEELLDPTGEPEQIEPRYACDEEINGDEGSPRVEAPRGDGR
jgi:hypothetical protein